jgi:hypothetical protein
MKNLCKSVIKQRKKIEKKHKGLSPKEKRRKKIK